MLGYRIRTLEVLVELWLEAEHFSQALVDAERLVDLDPLRETGHEALIRAHIGTGNQVLALRAYEKCRSVLLEEVGASPGPAIQALYERLLAS
jgi:DNA-binding SARP family transcriptional activator